MRDSLFSEEEKNFIKNNAKSKTINELTILINNKFNKNFGINQIRNFKKSKKIKSGVDTKFQKLTKPHNYKPLFSEFINSDGYVEIKIAEPNKWQLKHRYIYEQKFGKIKDGYSVIFADGDRTNFDIGNLLCVKVKDKLVMKNQHLFYKDAELTRTGSLIAKLVNKTSEIKKGVNNER